jgi:hypothetical protein
MPEGPAGGMRRAWRDEEKADKGGEGAQTNQQRRAHASVGHRTTWTSVRRTWHGRTMSEHAQSG